MLLQKKKELFSISLEHIFLADLKRVNQEANKEKGRQKLLDSEIKWFKKHPTPTEP